MLLRCGLLNVVDNKEKRELSRPRHSFGTSRLLLANETIVYGSRFCGSLCPLQCDGKDGLFGTTRTEQCCEYFGRTQNPSNPSKPRRTLLL